MPSPPPHDSHGYDGAVNAPRREAPSTSSPDAWRPMAFEFDKTRKIKDPVCEPFWSGSRTLVDVRSGDVAFRDEDGEAVEGFTTLREAIAGCVSAAEAVLDGYLLPAPLRDTVGAEAMLGDDATPTPGQVSRQLLFGGSSNRQKEDRLTREERVIVLEPDAPAAFMAIDLLWLDGESLLNVPLLERKRLLDAVLAEHEIVRRTMHVRPPVTTWYRQWRALGFRAYVIKSANSHYRPGALSEDWTANIIPAS